MALEIIKMKRYRPVNLCKIDRIEVISGLQMLRCGDKGLGL